jgi:hypothetical protein
LIDLQAYYIHSVLKFVHGISIDREVLRSLACKNMPFKGNLSLDMNYNA